MIFSNELLNTMKPFTVTDIVNLVKGITEETPAFVEKFSMADMYKKDNPYFGKIFKRSLIHGMIGKPYSTLVTEKQTDGIEPFVSGKRPWGEAIGPSLVFYKDTYYLNMEVKATLGTEYFFKINDGEPLIKIETEKISAFLKPEKETPTAFRTISFDHIVRIKIGENFYLLQQIDL